jgi:hypothetical protein
MQCWLKWFRCWNVVGFARSACYNDGMKTATTLSALDQIIDQLCQCLSPDSAKRVIKLRANPKVQKRVHQLADRCSAGTLTPEERAEYGDIVVLDTFIGIWKSKARQRLAKSGE